MYFLKNIGKLFLLRLRPHVMNSENYCKFQSAYRKGYCTETALLRVTNDIQRAAGQGLCTALLALDISAAFEAVHHDTLLDRARTHGRIKASAGPGAVPNAGPLQTYSQLTTPTNCGPPKLHPPLMRHCSYRIRHRRRSTGLDPILRYRTNSADRRWIREVNSVLQQVRRTTGLGSRTDTLRHVCLSSRRRHCTASCTLPSVRLRHAVICVTKATRLRHDSQLGAVRNWRLAVVHWKCATAQSHEDRGSDLWNKPAAKTSFQYIRRVGRRSPRQVLRRCQAPWSDTRLSTDDRQTHHERYSLLSLAYTCTATYSSATNSWYG